MPTKVQQDLEQILGLVERLKTSINSARTALEKAPSGQAWTRDVERLISMQHEYNRLLEQAETIKSRSVLHRLVTAPGSTEQGVRIGGGSPNQAGRGQSALSPITSESNAAYLDLMTGYNKKSAVSAERAAKSAQKRAEAEAKAATETQRLADARTRVANSPEYRDALAQAKRAGFGVENLQSIEDRGGGVQRLKFANVSGGVNQQFSPYVNTKTGASNPGLSSQFRSFGSDILRDIGQFTKWSIAIAAVYTPMQKLGELITIMIDNESKLADAAIAANVPFERAGEIFDTSAEAANKAGEAINTTIDAYAQAIRAVGRYESESVKAQAATALLSDSLILSKLSALDQASAIDTLSAALLQSDRELNQGQELLNKWVKVSQIANVSIDGLATGVAVLGDSAETVGLSIDQLNGLIAVLSEQSISGSKEAANTAKALVGAYQSDKAEAALNKYGVALRNASGEVRGFLEIYQDLARLRQQGVLSEAAISEIALALGGGGVRRAKDASALINSTERLNKIAEESAGITGKDSLANDALAKKLETVQTANTRLSNSFQELAQTLGDDGGMLDLFKGMINLLTGMVSASNDLFSVLGRSGPVLATFTAGLIALNSLSGGRRATAIKGLGGLQNWGAGIGNDIAGIRQMGGGGFGRGILADILAMNNRGGTILGAGAIASSAASNLQAGKNEQAIANVVGGVIGGAIGGVLSGGIGIAAGAAIGSSVADSAVTGILSHSQDLTDFFAQVQGGASAKLAGEGYAPKETSTEDLIAQLYKMTGGGNEFLGGLGAKLGYGASKLSPYSEFASPEAVALQALKSKAERGGDAESQLLYSQLQERFARENAAQGVLPPGTSSAEIARNRQQIAELQKMAENERTRQLEKVSTGELKPSEFGRITERLGGFAVTTKQEVDAFGSSFINLSKDINTTEEAYAAFLELTVNGTDEQQAQINQYVSDIQKLKAALDEMRKTPGERTIDLTTGTQTFNNVRQLQAQLTTTQNQAAQFTNASIINARLQKLQLPGIVGSATEATSGTDIESIKQQAEKLQQQFYTDMNLTNEEIKHMRNSLEDFSVFVERAGEEHFETITGIDQKFWDAAQKLLVEQGKLKDEKGIGFQKFDVPMSTLQSLGQKSLSIGQSWQKKFNYDFKPEDQIAIDNQGIVQPLHADFKILALLLEKIVDQNQKQLDGQYNIPEGATFWVPLTAAYYRRAPGGDSNGLGDMLANMDFEENTTATDRNTSALDYMSKTLEAMDDPRRGRGYATQSSLQDDPRRGRGYKESQPISEAMKRSGISSAIAANPALASARRTGDAASNGVFQQMLSEMAKAISATGSGVSTLFSGAGAAVNSLTGRSGKIGGASAQAGVSPTTKLDLRLSSNINLVVDGRVLANAMQSYLASELLRTEQSQSTITKRYVI